MSLTPFRRYIARVSIALLCLFVLFSLWRFAGEADRQRARDARQDQRLEQEIRADCAFKLRMANVPKLTRYPSVPLVDLASAARTAYIHKGCAGAINPEDGRAYPPAPPVYVARPSPTPAAP